MDDGYDDGRRKYENERERAVAEWKEFRQRMNYRIGPRTFRRPVVVRIERLKLPPPRDDDVITD